MIDGLPDDELRIPLPGTVFVGRTRPERTIRWIFIVSSVAAIAALIGLALIYRRELEYGFEVIVISINWTVLIVAGTSLSMLFGRGERYEPASRAGRGTAR